MGLSVTDSTRVPVYSVVDNAGLLALTSMLEGDLCLQEDTSTWYYYNGVSWALLTQSDVRLIEHKILTGTATSTTFTGLSGYDYFLCIGTIYGSNATLNSIGLKFNGDSGNNYSYKYIATTTLGNATGQPAIAMGVYDNAICGSFNILITVNKFGSSNLHQVVGHSHSSNGAVTDLVQGGAWANANAITEITILGTALNNNLNGVVSLYGLNTI